MIPNLSSSSLQPVQFRALRTSDIDAAWGLSCEQLWPHRSVDWADALALGEGVAATVDGKLVGTAMRWLWGSTHATVGLVIVSETMRGRRIGSALMDRVLEGLEDRTVCLHATEEGRGLYERLGFVRTGEIRQHQGIASNAPLQALDAGWRLRPMDHSDHAAILELDFLARGWHRQDMLQRWLGTAEQVMVLDHDGQVDGYAIMRRFGRGLTIGPVVASDDIGARCLIAHLVSLAAGRFVRMDLDFDSGLASWAEELKLKRVGTVTTMARGAAINGNEGPRLFALATQALG
jgi:predicted GNAT family N-acyltransferase